MKESLQSSPKAEPVSDRRIITDLDAVRALAHPHRVSILQYLLSGPPRTATECAAEVGGTPSACSYHLRELERFRLVERAEPADDGRARPWRAAAAGFSVGVGTDGTPAARAASAALTSAELTENQRLLQRYLDRRDTLDDGWRQAADLHTFELAVTADELRELNAAIAEVLRRYRAPSRGDAPPDAQPVHVVYQAFPRLPGDA